MKIIFLISALLTVAVAQQPVGVSCAYYFSFDTYRCELTINNPNGLDDFTEIGGIHLDGFTNADVTYIFRTAGESSNVPSIICNTFPNLDRLMFYNTGIREITDSSFAGCTRVTELDLVLNRINSISANAFAALTNLEYAYLESNELTTLPETLFTNQRELIVLDLNSNPLNHLPTALFRPLENLRTLFLGYADLDAVNNEWFTTNSVLDYLYLAGNRVVLTAESFAGLDSLTYLNLAGNNFNEIPAEALAPLQNLQYLYLYDNEFSVLEADSFPNLSNLVYLDISNNPTIEISDGAFRGLGNLSSLSLTSGRLRQLNPNSFEGLTNLDTLQMNFNEIEELPAGVFVPLPNIVHIGLWNNRLKTLRRNIFGSLQTLETLDLDGNIVNAVDRAIIDDAVNLNTLYFNGNLCANNYFGNFPVSRNQYLAMLQRCFDNMRFIVGKTDIQRVAECTEGTCHIIVNYKTNENSLNLLCLEQTDLCPFHTTTEADGQYSFFDGPQPGVVIRVNADSEVQIALTPFNFEWSPMLEIFIGSANNTQSGIRINQDATVVTVPTPNIITTNQWNDFRITWANQLVLVYRGNDSFPFMAFTMREFFPVNFYGLRAVESTASWTIQPLDPPRPPDGPFIQSA